MTTDTQTTTTGPVYIRLADTMDTQAAAIHAAALARRLRATVAVCDSVTGALVAEHGPRAGRAAAKPAKAKAGPDWSSKSGRAVRLMQRPEGATMDEIRDVTGWSFGAKYAACLERSFGVVITVKPASARVKRTWHAAAAQKCVQAVEPVQAGYEFAGYDEGGMAIYRDGVEIVHPIPPAPYAGLSLVELAARISAREPGADAVEFLAAAE